MTEEVKPLLFTREIGAFANHVVQVERALATGKITLDEWSAAIFQLGKTLRTDIIRLVNDWLATQDVSEEPITPMELISRSTSFPSREDYMDLFRYIAYGGSNPYRATLPPSLCSKCHQPLEPTYKYCPYCKHKIKKKSN